MKRLLASRSSEEDANAALADLKKVFPGREFVITKDGGRHKLEWDTKDERVSQPEMERMRRVAKGTAGALPSSPESPQGGEVVRGQPVTPPNKVTDNSGKAGTTVPKPSASPVKPPTF
jgi:hypothetical protein